MSLRYKTFTPLHNHKPGTLDVRARNRSPRPAISIYTSTPGGGSSVQMVQSWCSHRNRGLHPENMQIKTVRVESPLFPGSVVRVLLRVPTTATAISSGVSPGTSLVGLLPHPKQWTGCLLGLRSLHALNWADRIQCMSNDGFDS